LRQGTCSERTSPSSPPRASQKAAGSGHPPSNLAGHTRERMPRPPSSLARHTYSKATIHFALATLMKAHRNLSSALITPGGSSRAPMEKVGNVSRRTFQRTRQPWEENNTTCQPDKYLTTLAMRGCQ
jgi:hypothetical protein